MSRFGNIADVLAQLIEDRKERPLTGSYTHYLQKGGLDRILAKLNEECLELTLAAKNENPARVLSEGADLVYHLLVLWDYEGLSLDQLAAELEARRYKEEQ